MGIVRFLKKIENLGINKSKKLEYKAELLFNRITLFTLLLALPYTPIFYFSRLPLATAMVLVPVSMCLLTFLLIYFNKQVLARTIMVFGLNIVVFLYSIYLGMNYGAYLLYFGLASWSFILFDKQNPILRILGISTPFIFSIYIQWLAYTNPSFANLQAHISDSTVRIIHMFATLTGFGFVILTQYTFYISENEAKEALRKSLEDVKKKKKMDAEYRVASEIQHQFLPLNPPKLEGIDIEVLYLPSQKVSGDFFDFIGNGANNLGILVADVIGKGLPASFITISLYAIIHSRLSSSKSASEVLSKLNSAINKVRAHRHQCAAFYASLDLKRGILNYANAGIGTAFIVRNNKVILLEEGGFILGSMEDIRYDEEEIKLFEDDLVVIASDGVTDIRNKYKERLGEEKFISLVKKLYKKQDMNSLKQSIQSGLDDFNSGTIVADDDIVLILIKVKIKTSYSLDAFSRELLKEFVTPKLR